MIVISEFESVCQKELVLYRSWSEKPDEDHRQRHNRVAADCVRTSLEYVSQSLQEPASSSIQFHRTELVSLNISVNNDRLPASSWPRSNYRQVKDNFLRHFDQSAFVFNSSVWARRS